MTRVPHLEQMVRSSDPDTSWEAAAIAGERWAILLRDVHQVIGSYGPLTDDELVWHYEMDGFPRVTPQRIRTARRALSVGWSADFGRVHRFPVSVVEHPVSGRSQFGRRARRWVVADVAELGRSFTQAVPR